MFRANQRQLLQEVNVGVVELRQLEINYYFNVNAAVGTQATLIGGFTYGLFTQNIPNDHPYALTCLSAYFACSAVTIFAAIHVVLNTVLLQVYAPGLALHGPAGSMAKAAEVMADEQKQVMISFAIMLIFFSISTVLCFWVVMDFYSSIASTICFIIAVRQWLYHARRIYRKLYLDKAHAKGLYADVLNQNNIDPITIAQQQQAEREAAKAAEAQQRQSQRSEQLQSQERSSFRVAMKAVFGNGSGGVQKIGSISGAQDVPTQSGDSGGDGGRVATAEATSGKAAKPNPSSLAMEGYLTKKSIRRGSVAGNWTNWDRRYYVLNHGGIMTGYQNRQEFRANTQSSLKERPIEVEDFSIYLDSTLVEIEESETRSVMSNAGADNKTTRELFRITMVSKDQEYLRKIVFRCDTEEELQLWSEALTLVAPNNIVKTANEERKLNI